MVLKNKKGQVLLYGFMLTVTIIILALALAPVIRDRTDNARNLTSSDGEVTGLDCTNSSISIFNKATCQAVDMTLFLFVGGLIFIAGAIATARIVFS